MQVNFKKSRQVLHREKRIDWFNSTKKKHLRNAAGGHSVEKANTLFAPSADYLAIRKEENYAWNVARNTGRVLSISVYYVEKKRLMEAALTTGIRRNYWKARVQ